MTWKAKIWLVSLLIVAGGRARGRETVFSWPLLLNRAGGQAQPLLNEVEHRITSVLGYVAHVDVAPRMQRAFGVFGWWPDRPGGVDLWAYKGMGIDYVITGWIDKTGCTLRVIRTSDARPLISWHGKPFTVYNFLQDLVTRIGLAPPPFGTWILFSYRPSGSLNKQIRAIEFPSGRIRILHAPKGLNIFPTWFKDRAAYITYTRGGPMLRLGNRMLGLPGNPMGFAAAPDGKRLAIALNKDSNTDIYVMDMATLRPKAPDKLEDKGCRKWFRCKELSQFARRRTIGTSRIKSVKTTKQVGRSMQPTPEFSQVLWVRMQRLTFSRAIDTSPAWSADARRIVFVSDRSGFPQLWIINDLQNPKPECLDLPGNYNTSPDWANDNDLIAFQTRVGLSFRICTYRLSTHALHCLPLMGRSDEDPTFSPDGRLIAFVEQDKNDRPLMIWDILTGKVTRLSPLDGLYFTPAWEIKTKNTVKSKLPD